MSSMEATSESGEFPALLGDTMQGTFLPIPGDQALEGGRLMAAIVPQGPAQTRP